MSAEKSEAVTATLTALRRVTLAGENFRLVFAQSLGVRFIDTVALSHLAADGPMAVGELAKRIGVAPSGATTLVDRLERAQLVRRQKQQSNRRTVEIALTDKGAESLDAIENCARVALTDVGLDELPTLTRLLDRLAESLGERSAEYADHL